MEPINRPYPDVISELQQFVRSWKWTHRLSDVQVVAALSQAAADYSHSAYVELSREDKEGRPDRVPRIPIEAGS